MIPEPANLDKIYMRYNIDEETFVIAPCTRGKRHPGYSSLNQKLLLCRNFETDVVLTFALRFNTGSTSPLPSVMANITSVKNLPPTLPAAFALLSSSAGPIFS